MYMYLQKVDIQTDIEHADDYCTPVVSVIMVTIKKERAIKKRNGKYM